MKLRIAIAVMIALGLGLGWVQRAKFAKLQVEAAILGNQVSKLASRISPRGQASLSQAMAHRTTRESDPAAFGHMEAILGISERNFMIAETWRNPATRTPEATAALKDSMKNEPAEMWPHFAKLNHRQVLELIGRLQSSPHTPDMDKPNIPQVCVERLVETNAAEALQLILKLEDLPERDRYLTQAFFHLAVENPGEAVRWFDEQSKNGEPVTRTPEMLESMMLAEARHDPARAVSGFLANSAEAPDSIALLGAKLASELRNTDEHRAMLAAFRSQDAKGSSQSLAKIRTQYIANLASEMRGWPIEEATGLMDSEFLTSEMITASKIISPSGLAEADQWATWFSKIDVPENDKHPLVNFVGSWVQSDATAAGNWLNQTPSGDLKNRAILQYTTLGEDVDPAHAARLLITIPASPDREVLLDRVLANWKAKDPSSAAAFAKEYDLTQ